ncbi:MAG: hypothetical protein KBE19_04440 [Rhodocyclaceae bacterium]|nr:hypothetical protein [Rhodocyclaceae bacterium]
MLSSFPVVDDPPVLFKAPASLASSFPSNSRTEIARSPEAGEPAPAMCKTTNNGVIEHSFILLVKPSRGAFGLTRKTE